ncbi:Up in starvation, partial [Cryomyces antarcticus]
MSSFRAVNTTLTVSEQLSGRLGEETTPTTPRQNRTFAEMPSTQIRADESTPNTPTRHSFGGVVGQRPLPASPFPSSHDATQAEGQRGLLTRGLSHQSTHSVDSQDVDMEDDDDDSDGSDNESVTSDSQRPSKKKKGQRFFCTDFPPCQLSFTRRNILVNGPFSAIVPADSPVSTTYVSMRKLYMSTKRYPVTPRRLSVPSGVNPFQSPQGTTFPPLFFSPPSASSLTFPGNDSVYASPTSSVFSERHDSAAAAELDWRRRTWHPGTYQSFAARPATSGLSYYQTPDQPRPYSSAQPAATQMTRLPGIESFDHAPFPSRPQPGPGPLSADATNRPSVFAPAPGPDNRRSQSQLDMSLHQNLTKLDITGAAPPQHEPQSWNRPVDTGQPQTARHVTALHPNHPFHAPMTTTQSTQSPSAYTRVIKLDEVVTPRKHKRQAWYNGPIGSAAAQTAQPHYVAQRTSPEDSSSSEGIPTPSTSTAAEFHPSIVHASGYIEPHPVGPDDQQQKAYPGSAANVQHYPLHSGHDPRSMQPSTDRGTDMGRLEALVAVATSE